MKGMILVKKMIGNYKIQKLSELNLIELPFINEQIYQSLRMLNFEYPGFKKWYWNLFYKKQFLKDGREILFCKVNKTIIAVSILKSTLEEKKICTFRVNKNFQGEGIGTELMKKSLEWLNTDKPLITVHKSKEHQFYKIFKYFDFKPEQSLKRYYRCFTEISYNGVLPEKKIIINNFESINLQNFIYKAINENGFEDVQNAIEYYLYKYVRNTYNEFNLIK